MKMHSMPERDQVNHPKHYTSSPSGIECIEIVEHMGFNLGNAVKYVWRADLKGNALEDLEKARWYIEREIKRRKIEAAKGAAGQPGKVAVLSGAEAVAFMNIEK